MSNPEWSAYPTDDGTYVCQLPSGENRIVVVPNRDFLPGCRWYGPIKKFGLRPSSCGGLIVASENDEFVLSAIESRKMVAAITRSLETGSVLP